jgi:hypothetical protein
MPSWLLDYNNLSSRAPTGSRCRVAACYSWYDALPPKSRYALHLHAVTIACQPHLESSFLQARLPRLLLLWVPDPASPLHFSCELNRLVCDPVHQTRPSHVPTWPSTTVLPSQNTCIRGHRALYRAYHVYCSSPAPFPSLAIASWRWQSDSFSKEQQHQCRTHTRPAKIGLLISPRPCSRSPCFETAIDNSSLPKRIVKELRLIISRFLRYYCMQVLWQSRAVYALAKTGELYPLRIKNSGT